MIIFYNKTTGDIVGTIDGRIHSEQQLKMWAGDKNEVDRLIVEWKPVKFYDKDGKFLPKFDEECIGSCDKNGNQVAWTSDFEPDCPEDIKEEMMRIDKKKQRIKDLKVNPKKKKLRKMTKAEIDKKSEEKQKMAQEINERQKIKADAKKIIMDRTKSLEERFEALAHLVCPECFINF